MDKIWKTLAIGSTICLASMLSFKKGVEYGMNQTKSERVEPVSKYAYSKVYSIPSKKYDIYNTLEERTEPMKTIDLSNGNLAYVSPLSEPALNNSDIESEKIYPKFLQPVIISEEGKEYYAFEPGNYRYYSVDLKNEKYTLKDSTYFFNHPIFLIPNEGKE